MNENTGADSCPRRERRMKIARLDSQLIVDILNWHNQPYMIALPQTQEIPDDCEVIDLYYDPASRCIHAVIAHHSFEATPQGSYLPFINEYITEVRQIVTNQKEESRNG